MLLKNFEDLSCSWFLFFVETRNSCALVIVTYYAFIGNALLRAYRCGLPLRKLWFGGRAGVYM